MAVSKLGVSADGIANALTVRIVRGELAPDAKLRQEHVADEFKVSHVPVREAFLRLVAKGLAVSKPNVGVRVAPLDQAAQREVKLMRAALEPVALMHSVPNLTQDEIGRLEDLRLACDAAADIHDWEAANRAFHLGTMAACGMPRLLEEVGNLQLHGSRHMLVQYRERWKPRPDPDHHALMAAIRARDVQGALATAERHLGRAV
ncbi:GntR family transcriptional regulator [Brevundimonas sp.]|uniref:GntR family transcriptional regulator n=1 Tax=Brevundimonas sp. TaxID=1871086 RepID=UPI0028B04D84|nr:GntR family transcriptional regulator [Brevundimonas sp.]